GIHTGAFGVVEPPEEERDARDVAQGLRPVVQVGLEVLLRDPVSRHRLQPEHVLAHQPQELTGAAQVVALGGANRVSRAGRAVRRPGGRAGGAGWAWLAGWAGGTGRAGRAGELTLGWCGAARRGGVTGPAGRRHASSPRWVGEPEA